MYGDESSAGVGWVGRLKPRPLDSAAILVLLAAAAMIIVNALYLQPGPHPAPIFHLRPGASVPERGAEVVAVPRPRPFEAGASRPAASAAASRTGLVIDIQRELQQRGFYDGPVDGVYGSKTDAAIRDFEQMAGLKSTGEPSEEVLRLVMKSSAKANGRTPPAPASNRPDPLGDLIAPPAKRVVAVQRALTDFGYGQLRPTGVMGPETSAAIEKFEQSRRLPVTGMISDRLVRELAAMTGRPLE